MLDLHQWSKKNENHNFFQSLLKDIGDPRPQHVAKEAEMGQKEGVLESQ